MARHASTYRKARREMARVLEVDWKRFNSVEYWQGEEWLKAFESVPDLYEPFVPKPSRYTPHTGAKQRAKGAAK